jgi:hypothetical protein
VKRDEIHQATDQVKVTLMNNQNGEEEKNDEIRDTNLVADTQQLFDEFPQPQISKSIVMKQFQDRYEEY